MDALFKILLDQKVKQIDKRIFEKSIIRNIETLADGTPSFMQ